jgi:hypothetical protein
MSVDTLDASCDGLKPRSAERTPRGSGRTRRPEGRPDDDNRRDRRSTMTTYHHAMKVSNRAVAAVTILVVLSLVLGPILEVAGLIRF